MKEDFEMFGSNNELGYVLGSILLTIITLGIFIYSIFRII